MFASIRCALIALCSAQASGYIHEPADQHPSAVQNPQNIEAPHKRVLFSLVPPPEDPVHSADPQICTVLGILIICGWVANCMGGAAGAAAEDQGKAGAVGLVACISTIGGIAALVSLIYVIATGLLSAWYG